MSFVSDSYRSRDYHDNIESRVLFSGTRFVSAVEERGERVLGLNQGLVVSFTKYKQSLFTVSITRNRWRQDSIPHHHGCAKDCDGEEANLGCHARLELLLQPLCPPHVSSALLCRNLTP